MQRDSTKMNDKIVMGLGKGIKDGSFLKSNCFIELFGSDGKRKDFREVHNTVTVAGLAGVADQVLASPTLAKVGWMELGTGSPSGTKLGAYISGSRNALTSKTRSAGVITLVGDWAAGDGTGAITEAGTFDVVTEDTVNMWMSATFAVINKGASDTLTITWTLTLS